MNGVLFGDACLVLGELGWGEDIFEEGEACVEQAALVLDAFGLNVQRIPGGCVVRELAQRLDGLGRGCLWAKRQHRRIQDESQRGGLRRKCRRIRLAQRS